jgi:endonuclease/exonuclease/phosphatase family metal-dependent hydrolase
MEIESGSFIRSETTECPSVLRVVSWNIARGVRLDSIMEFLAIADADIILLQEADKNARRSNYLNIAEEIARRLKLSYVFGCEFEELGQGSPASPAYHGQATLSRWPLLNASILRFHTQSNFWRPRWFIPTLGPLQRRQGGRIALRSNAPILGRNVVTYNLHCESRGNYGLRLSQLREFLQDAKRYSLDVPVIAAGDFNFDLSVGQAAAALADAGFVNLFATMRQATTISHSHSSRDQMIDWILLRGGLVGANPEIHSSVLGSDHYPLTLTVRFSSAT